VVVRDGQEDEADHAERGRDVAQDHCAQHQVGHRPDHERDADPDRAPAEEVAHRLVRLGGVQQQRTREHGEGANRGNGEGLDGHDDPPGRAEDCAMPEHRADRVLAQDQADGGHPQEVRPGLFVPPLAPCGR